MENKGNALIGLSLVGLGLLFLILQWEGIDLAFSWATLWPLALLVPGVAFHALYLEGPRHWGALIPGGILVTYSLLFFWNTLFGWHWMARLWPVFILGPAVGLAEAYLASRQVGLLIPAAILGAVGGLFLVLFSGSTLLLGLLCVGAGVLLLRRPGRRQA